MTNDDSDGCLSETVSFKLSDGLNSDIEAELDGPHQKSEWIREACREKLDAAQQPAAPVSE